MEDLGRFLQILNEPVQFADPFAKEDEGACGRLLEELSQAEADEVACASYAYWTVRSKASENLPADAQRTSALKEIRRHYVGEGRDYDKTLAAIREALDYRRQYRIDVIRSCFYDTNDREGEEDELANKYRRFVLDDLETQPMVVHGVDDHDRVIIYKSPRKSPSGNPEAGEAFVLTQIYTAERAIATNEFTSGAKEEKLTAVFNFSDYLRSNSPPISVMITMAKVLQRCYPERLGVLIIVNPPFWIRGVFNIMRPFLSAATTEKVRLASGQTAVDEEFNKIVSSNKALKLMLVNGDISSVDLTDYTQKSFYSQFG